MIKIRLDQYLQQHGLSAYRLVKETKGKVARNSVYSLARGDMQRVDLDTLSVVMEALEGLTGESLSFDDLFERVELEEDLLLDSGFADLKASLTDIEAELSPEDLSNWLTSFGIANS